MLYKIKNRYNVTINSEDGLGGGGVAG
jgi:hypothetical protein